MLGPAHLLPRKHRQHILDALFGRRIVGETASFTDRCQRHQVLLLAQFGFLADERISGVTLLEAAVLLLESGARWTVPTPPEGIEERQAEQTDDYAPADQHPQLHHGQPNPDVGLKVPASEISRFRSAAASTASRCARGRRWLASPVHALLPRRRRPYAGYGNRAGRQATDSCPGRAARR